VTDFLSSLDQSAFGTWVTGSSSLFAFPGILLLHTIGMSLVVGIVVAIDLKILGFAPALPLAPLKKFLPILWGGFTVNAITGTMLLIADASTKMTNPDFGVKMVLILFAVINLRMIQKKVLADPLLDTQPMSTNAKVLAVMSLFLWFGAITAGRLLAYVGPVAGID